MVSGKWSRFRLSPFDGKVPAGKGVRLSAADASPDHPSGFLIAADRAGCYEYCGENT